MEGGCRQRGAVSGRHGRRRSRAANVFCMSLFPISLSFVYPFEVVVRMHVVLYSLSMDLVVNTFEKPKNTSHHETCETDFSIKKRKDNSRFFLDVSSQSGNKKQRKKQTSQKQKPSKKGTTKRKIPKQKQMKDHSKSTTGRMVRYFLV